jgi:tripartite-type tricarboxylate transporter receptor subunit TctC
LSPLTDAFNSPEEFAAAIKSEIPVWAKLIKESGIKPISAFSESDRGY